MDHKGGIATEVLVMMVLVVLTSGIILLLVNTGVVTVKADANYEPILNTEFIPSGRGGSLVIKEFKFCSGVDESYNCIDPKVVFDVGQEVHFRFVVQSSTYDGNVILVENYRVRGPNGDILLDVDSKNDFNFDVKSKDVVERIHFKDFIYSEDGDQKGDYTLELLMVNPLLNKEVTLVEKFALK
jgi:hypothetical protein